MTQAASKFVLAISTRDLVFAFTLAKGVAVLSALAIMAGRKNHEDLAFIVASVVAVGVFIALVLLAGRCSLSRLLGATQISRPPWRMPAMAAFVSLAIPLGLLLRFGNGGLVLGAFRVFDSPSYDAVLADALSPFSGPAAGGLTWLLVINMLTGAFEEELIYRRILQSRFCGRYGLAGGILIVSVIFYLMHITNPMAFVAGVFFSLLYVFTGRLWVPVVTHAAANLAFPALATLRVSTTPSGFVLVTYVSAVLLCVAAVAMFMAISQRTVPPYERQPIIRRGNESAAPK